MTIGSFVPFIHEGLGNSSYLVELGDGAAALIDPDRTVARYVAAAAARDWHIVASFETHLHADFVSGTTALAARTGATGFVPQGARVRFPHQPLAPGQRIRLAEAEIEAVASPGHTPEHLSYVLRRHAGPPLLFSGGSLLVGGAARTDLIAPEQTGPLTRAQFATITTAFAGLPDATLLLPTHGGGSFCSSGASSQRTSTLGQERRANPLFAIADADTFVHWFPTTFPAAPRYFFHLRGVNQAGPALRSSLQPVQRLAPAAFDAARSSATVIDLRPQADFMAGHIPGSLSNAFRDAFATWLGWLLPLETALLFVCGSEPLEPVIDECLLVGFERFVAVLDGGIDAWMRAGFPTRRATLVDGSRAASCYADGAIMLDVREPGEFVEEHIVGARNIPLGSLERRLAEVPAGAPIITYCGHGERSATALSLIERAGFEPLFNLNLGIDAWKQAGGAVTSAAPAR